jgi:hypothetical protein
MLSTALRSALRSALRAALLATLLGASGALHAAAQSPTPAQVLVADGDGDYALAKEILGFGGAPEFSFDLWVRADGASQDGLLVGVQDAALVDGFRLSATVALGRAELVFETQPPGGAATLARGAAQALADGGWHHVAAVDDGSATLVYLDGRRVASGASSGAPWDLANAYIGVGGIVFATGGFFHGAFDDVRLWTRALGAAEVARIANGAQPLATAGLAVHYRYDGDLSDSAGDEPALPAGDVGYELGTHRRAPLVSFPRATSLTGGGRTALSIDAGARAAHGAHVVLGSLSAGAPGIDIGVGTLPLVADAWFLFTLTAPNQPPYTNARGSLDAAGRAVAFVEVPAASHASLAGLTLHHAALVFDARGVLLRATNAVELRLVL